MNFNLAKNKGESQFGLDYARVLGVLMYVMNCTRPYRAYAISKLSRYTSNPNQNHWIEMKRVLWCFNDIQNYAFH